MKQIGSRWKLTDTGIKNLSPSDISSGKSSRDYWDSEMPKLILRLSKRSKVFYVYANRKMKKLGLYGSSSSADVFNIDRARQQAHLMLSRLSKTSSVLDLTLEHYLDHMYREDRINTGKPVSEDAIKSIKQAFSFLLNTKLKDIKHDHIEQWRASSKNKDVTKRKQYTIFKSMFNTLVRRKYISFNPIELMKFNDDGKKTVDTHDVSLSEVAHYVDSLPYSDEGKFIILSIMYTGARPIEVIRSYARRYEIESDSQGSVNLITEFSKAQGRLIYVNSPIWVKYLRILLDKRLSEPSRKKREQLMTSIYVRDNSLVYSNFTYQVYRPVWDSVKSHFNLVGRAYDFRHTFASKIYKEHSDIKFVAHMLGDTLETASKYYTKLHSNVVKERLSNLD